MIKTPNHNRSEDEIRADWRTANVKPLWEIDAAHTPTSGERRPGVWKWATMERLIKEAIRLTTLGNAERRVLSLVDPSAKGEEFHAVTNLNAGLQILLPGEAARPHRHTMNALRFVLSGSGAITRVDGKEAEMAEGDLVLTPGWAWHEHWHAGSEPIVWLDVLDVQLHMNLGTFEFEPGPPHDVPELLPQAAFASANLVPDIPPTEHSPVFRYPLADAVSAVGATPAGRDGARRIRYVNPLNGGPVMSMLDCYLVKLDPGTTTVAVRSTANAICCIVKGRGSSRVGETEIDWSERDVFALPHRMTVRHAAAEPALLFIVTDREVYRRLGLLREEYL